MKYDRDFLYNNMVESDKWDFKFLSLVERVLNEIENPMDNYDVYRAIEDITIYNDRKWQILMHYCTPEEADYQTALNEFSQLILHLTSLLSE